MRNLRLLLAPDPADSGGPDIPPPSAKPAPAPDPIPAPPAAAVVTAGKKTEADVAAELENKNLQARIAQLEDENRSLKQVPSAGPSGNADARQKQSWLEGGSFFD